LNCPGLAIDAPHHRIQQQIAVLWPVVLDVLTSRPVI
jgi:hypothetical protein